MYCSYTCLGVGLGLINLSAIAIVAIYFEEKRAFATSIASCGSNVGTVIMAPLFNFLDNKFGWAYTLMLMGPFLLVCAPLGLVFKPISDNSSKIEGPWETSIEEKAFCTRFCSLSPQLPKLPNILCDRVFIICLLATFLANIGFPVAYSYTMVSTGIWSPFLFIYISHETRPLPSLGQCNWGSEKVMLVCSSLSLDSAASLGSLALVTFLTVPA